MADNANPLTPSQADNLLASLLLDCLSLQKPHATVGTPFALGLPLGCNRRAVRLTSFKPCVDGSRQSRSPSTAKLRRPSIYERWQSASYAAQFDTTTPLNVAVGSGAHFRQLARAASAFDSASTPTTSAAVAAAATASSCPPPNTDANATAVFAAPLTQCTRLRLPSPARFNPGGLVFTPRRLQPAYTCHEQGGRVWTGRALSLTKRSDFVAFPSALDDHGRRYAPVRIPHAQVESLAPSPPAGCTRKTNDAANAPLADDIARPAQPTLVNTPGMDSAARLPAPGSCTSLPRQGRRA
eukprot:6201424-Pleurochrysis_carterae.AAC.1